MEKPPPSTGNRAHGGRTSPAVEGIRQSVRIRETNAAAGVQALALACSRYTSKGFTPSSMLCSSSTTLATPS